MIHLLWRSIVCTLHTAVPKCYAGEFLKWQERKIWPFWRPVSDQINAGEVTVVEAYSLRMYCLQWLIPVLLLPKPVSSIVVVLWKRLRSSHFYGNCRSFLCSYLSSDSAGTERLTKFYFRYRHRKLTNLLLFRYWQWCVSLLQNITASLSLVPVEQSWDTLHVFRFFTTC